MADIANKNHQDTPWLQATTYTPPQNDEIDLKELFFVLWNQKKLILLTTGLCLLLGVLYTTTATKFWKTQAVITFPDLQDMRVLTSEVHQFKPFFDVDEIENSKLGLETSVTKNSSFSLNNLSAKERLFSDFLFQFNSTEHQLAFLARDPDMQTLIRYHDVDGRKVPKIEATMKKLKTNTGMASIPVATLTLQTSDAVRGEKFLRNYMAYINDIVADGTATSLQTLIESRQKELVQEKLFLEKKAMLTLQDTITKTEHALKITRVAKIIRPVSIQGNVMQEDVLSPSIMMGSDVLLAKLDTLKNVSTFSLAEPKIARLNALLQEMQKIKLKPISVQPYHYIEQAWSEDNYSHPKSLLIIVLSILLGGMLGMAVALIRHYVIGNKTELQEKIS